jgi:hypothetical protein
MCQIKKNISKYIFLNYIIYIVLNKNKFFRIILHYLFQFYLQLALFLAIIILTENFLIYRY